MLKKMLCAMLSLMLLACIFPLTGLAGEEQVLHTVNMLRFPAALTQIGDQHGAAAQDPLYIVPADRQAVFINMSAALAAAQK